MADVIVHHTGVAEPRHGLITLTHIVYALHGFSALMGLLTPAFIVTSFLFGWPSIIGVIINLVKRDEVRGTYLESHFSWQIRTFFYALLWVVVAVLLAFTIIGIPLAWIVAIVLGIWVLYRIVRGWLALVEGRSVRGAKYD
jgi:uncharacterized membrane protein